MSDLVKRLRESAEAWDDCGELENARFEREAADRIEALEAALREVIAHAEDGGTPVYDSLRMCGNVARAALTPSESPSAPPPAASSPTG